MCALVEVKERAGEKREKSAVGSPGGVKAEVGWRGDLWPSGLQGTVRARS